MRYTGIWPSATAMPSLLLVLSLLALVCHPLALSASANSLDDIRDRIYTSLPAEDACVTLATKDRLVGCHTGDLKKTGKLVLADSSSDLDELVRDSEDEMLAIVMPRQLFTKATLDRLNGGLKGQVAGVLFKPPSEAIPTQVSPAAKSPLSHLSPENIAFEWNPEGEDLFEERMEFAMLQLSDESWPDINEKLLDNASRRQNGDYERNFVELGFVMSATENSITCLDKFQCQPVGGYSVWATLGGRLNSSKELVFGIATLDATALIHTQARGADADASGLVALLAATSAVQTLGWATLQALDKQIVVAAFNAEAFDLAGSGRFVQEIENFACDVEPDTRRQPDCRQPLRADVSFTDLSTAKISSLLELQQVGFLGIDRPVLYSHRATTSSVDDLQQSLERAATAVGDITVEPPTAKGNGLPPSSSWSFIRERNNLRAIVLAEHDGPYTNKFYQSVSDLSVDRAHLCRVASVTAQALLLEAGAAPAEASEVLANCTLVDDLLDCFTKDFNCSLANRLLGDTVLGVDSTTSRYSGVYLLGAAHSGSVFGAPRLVYEFINSGASDATLDGTGNACSNDNDCERTTQFCRSRVCSNRTVHYHDAVDTALEFDYDANKYFIKERHGNTRVWTESNWDTLRARSFATASSFATTFALIGGVLIAFLTYGFTMLASKYGRARFKLD